MLDDSQAELLVTQKRILERVPHRAVKVIYLDTESEIISQQSCENLVNASTADDPAYVIYTSGSTGRPKGVMVGHRSACNHMMWMADEFQLSESDRVLQKYSVSFDASLAEIFYPIISGASLVIARHGEQYDISYLVELICEHQVTAIDVVPAMLKALIDYGVEDCTSLRRITCGGESLPPELKQRVYERLPGVELANLYGPTEATITATYYRCGQEQPRRSVPIGKPIANTQVYILDEWLDPVPVGVTGEIHIGGEAVAWGYLNRPELTAEKFMPDPFNKKSGARLYRTGDLARYLDDGSVEYIGRADRQVKLRGFRVELGELESSLKKHAAVKQAAVVFLEDDTGQKRLVAYVALNEARTATISELRAHLKKELPTYMVPAAIVVLEEMPLTAGGKIDRQALPSPEVAGPDSQTGYVAPRSEEDGKRCSG
jgi:amino acid adenylation domain-containing protein